MSKHFWATTEAAASELISAGQRHGVDLARLSSHSQFGHETRYLHLWRENCGYGYYIQGAVGVLPACLKGSESAFHGIWCEGGWLSHIDQAFEFARAWLLNGIEVDQLPARAVRNYSI